MKKLSVVNVSELIRTNRASLNFPVGVKHFTVNDLAELNPEIKNRISLVRLLVEYIERGVVVSLSRIPVKQGNLTIKWQHTYKVNESFI